MAIDPRHRGAVLLVVFATSVAAIVGSYAQPGAVPAPRPGRQRGGETLLPNGWRIDPAGHHLQVGDLPLNMSPSPDGRFIVITNNGWTKPTLTVFDTKTAQVIGRTAVDHAWLGLAWHPDGTRLYSAGAAENTIHEFTFEEGKLKEAGTIALGSPERRTGGEFLNAGFIGGLAIAADGKRLYATHVFGQAVSAIDLGTRQEVAKATLEAEPYTCLLSKDGRTLFVSLWGGAKVLMFAADTLAPLGEVAVGGHPNAMQLSADGARLFVACANTNAVWVIDLASRTAVEQISTALYPDAPVGTTPNSLALSPDGSTLLVANADNNTVAVVDVRTAGKSQVSGWIAGRVVPDVGPLRPGCEPDLRPRRQGADERPQPPRPAAGRRPDGRAVHGQHAPGGAVDHSRSRCRAAGRHDAARLRADAVHRCRTAGAAGRPGGQPDPAAGRRDVADPPRFLHRSRESHLRSGARRPAGAATAIRR